MNRMSYRQKIIMIYLAAFIILLVIVPLIVPIAPLAGTLPPEKLADADSKFIQLNGVNVHYKIAGRGEPTSILMHGFASSVFTWRNVMTPLAERGTVIAYDRTGFGITSRPLPGQWKGASPYSPDAQVDLLFAWMDELGIKKAILVGNSAGGSMAVLAALRKPERVQALVLVDPALSGSIGSSFPEWLKPIFAMPQMRRLGPLLVRNARDWGLGQAKRSWHDPAQITPEIWDGYFQALRANDWDVGLYEFNLATSSVELHSQLNALKMPALVITGDDDHIIPLESSVRAAKELPNARLVVIPGCGHAPQEECPAPFLQAVNEFLDGLGLPSS